MATRSPSHSDAIRAAPLRQLVGCKADVQSTRSSPGAWSFSPADCGSLSFSEFRPDSISFHRGPSWPRVAAFPHFASSSSGNPASGDGQQPTRHRCLAAPAPRCVHVLPRGELQSLLVETMGCLNEIDSHTRYCAAARVQRVRGAGCAAPVALRKLPASILSTPPRVSALLDAVPDQLDRELLQHPYAPHRWSHDRPDWMANSSRDVGNSVLSEPAGLPLFSPQRREYRVDTQPSQLEATTTACTQDDSGRRSKQRS